MKRKEYPEAKTHLQESAQIYSEALGEDHIWTSISSLHLATVLYLMGDIPSADSLFDKHIANLVQKRDGLRPVTKSNINTVLSNLEEIEQAEFAKEIEELRGLLANL